MAPTTRKVLFTLFMPLLPKRLVSRWFGRFARLRLPKPLRRSILQRFAMMYKLDMEEAEKPLEAYPTLDALFTRRLKEGARPILSDWIHPVDGELCANGRIHENQAFQIKGWSYSLSALLGEQRYEFNNGVFLTYYLCPMDYHRVHSPVSGEIVSIRHMQGNLWPVNSWSVNRIRNLFCLNERVVINYSTSSGPVSVVLVGATNVGNISLPFEPLFRTNTIDSAGSNYKSYTPAKPVHVGDEIGVFHMGSTVIVLASPEFARAFVHCPEDIVFMGEPVLETV